MALVQDSGPQFNIKMTFYQYRKSHCGDKMIVRSSDLYYVISYTGKMSSLYWIRAPDSIAQATKTLQSCTKQLKYLKIIVYLDPQSFEKVLYEC